MTMFDFRFLILVAFAYETTFYQLRRNMMASRG